MEITVDMVKELRARTGAGVLECKKALEETSGDFDRAVQLLRKRGLAKAAKKVGREVHEGVIEAYVHPGGRLASLVELNCETDFVARTEEFQALAHDLAMQIAATAPLYVDADQVPEEVLERERAKYRAEMEAQGKPPHIIDRIVENKLEKFLDQVCLLRQPFIKDEGMTVQALITSKIAQLGENIVVRRFARFELGEK
jgi:elongation factor Ts